MKKIIIFDFDGTIANTLPLGLNIAQKVLKDFGYELKKKQVEELRKMSPLDILTHIEFPIWKVPKLVRMVREDLAQQIDKVRLYPGIKNLLFNLKSEGFELGILTSNAQETVENFLKKHSLMIFDFILSEQNIFEKAKLIKNFLKKNNLKPNQVIYIGDEVRDIEASRQSGIPIISVTWGLNRKEILQKEKPNYLVQKAEDIFKIVKKL